MEYNEMMGENRVITKRLGQMFKQNIICTMMHFETKFPLKQTYRLEIIAHKLQFHLRGPVPPSDNVFSKFDLI